MKALQFKTRSLAEIEQVRLGPALLLPSLVSLFLALSAVMLGLGGVRGWTPLWVGVCVQAMVLALCAAGVAASHSASLNRWQRRMAPAAAGQRVRQALVQLAGQMAARGVAGPWVLALVLGWPLSAELGPMLAVLLAAAVLLLAALLAGLVLGASWQGRAPRGAQAAWLVVLAVGGAGYEIGPMMAGQPVLSLLLLASLCGGAWLLLLAPDALALRSMPLQMDAARAWLRRRHTAFAWTRVPAAWPQASAANSLWPLFVVFLLQAPTQGRYLPAVAWAQALGSERAALFYGLLLAVLSLFGGMFLVAPPLHWRRRLRPGGWTTRAWAQRLVIYSCSTLMLAISLFISLSLAFGNASVRAAQAVAWLPLMGDVLLAGTWAAWLRGRYNSAVTPFVAALALGAAAALLLLALQVVGVQPVRGAVWLLVQSVLAAILGLLAVRAWSRQDLNAIASRATRQGL